MDGYKNRHFKFVIFLSLINVEDELFYAKVTKNKRKIMSFKKKKKIICTQSLLFIFSP